MISWSVWFVRYNWALRKSASHTCGACRGSFPWWLSSSRGGEEIFSLDDGASQAGLFVSGSPSLEPLEPLVSVREGVIDLQEPRGFLSPTAVVLSSLLQDPPHRHPGVPR